LGADENAANGRDIAVIATPPNGDVAQRRQAIVGGIDVDPANAGAKETHPGMGSIDAAKFRLARRRVGFQITADVASGQAVRPQAGNLEMDKVLANAAALFENLQHGSGHCRCGRVENEVLVNTAREIGYCVEHGTTAGKGRSGVVGKFGGGRNQRGWIKEFMSFERLAGMIGPAAGANLFPWRSFERFRDERGKDSNAALGFDDELLMRGFDRNEMA